MSVAEFEERITPKAGRTLIVGSRVYGDKEDRRKRYPDVVGVDMAAGPGVDVVADLELEPVGMFDHIECMSVMEHCRRPWLIAQNLEFMLRSSGTLFITVPFIWRVHGYPDDYWRFTSSGVRSLFSKIKWTEEAYSCRELYSAANDIPSVRSPDDWPCFARTEVCMFGVRQ